jgi:hypothetical protein
MCGYLADVYCLGVKNALGPQIMNERDLPAFRPRFFTPFNEVAGGYAALRIQRGHDLDELLVAEDLGRHAPNLQHPPALACTVNRDA